MFGTHLKDVRTLMEIRRYQNKFKHKKRTVAEHSWFVSKIVHGLATWEKCKFLNKKLDMEKVIFFAINHDVAEFAVGDILTTTKNLSPIIKEELHRVEEIVFKEHILKTIPNSWGAQYLEMHEEMLLLKSIESKIVKAGDIIDRIFECMEEIELMNKDPYEDILKKDIISLFNLNLTSVNYFLKYSIKDINAHIYISKEIQDELDLMDFTPYF